MAARDSIGRRHELELGKRIAEKAGLDPSIVSEQWDATSDGKNVSVMLHVPLVLPAEEFRALNEQAAEAAAITES